MTSETENLKLKLQSLTSAFSDLEDQLSPLFTQSLPETLVHLEPIQQAKLQTALAYVAYDLIFIYLKTKGIDPKTHPVISELDRIKQYLDKIQNVENPAKRTTEVDKAAASRFIKHALSEAQLQQDKAKTSQLSWKKTSAEEAQESSSSSSEDEKQREKPNVKPQHKIPPKITSKILKRQQYDKELREQDSDYEDDVFDQSVQVDDQCMNEDDLLSAKEQGKKDKGKAKADQNPSGDPSSSVPMAHAASKRQRPTMDPFVASGFVGVGEEEQTTSPPSHAKLSHTTSRTPSTVCHASESLDKASKKDKKKKKSKNVNVPPL